VTSVLSAANSVSDTPYAQQDEISYKLTEFNKRQQSEAEPQTEHSAQVRYVLDRLYTI